MSNNQKVIYPLCKIISRIFVESVGNCIDDINFSLIYEQIFIEKF